MIQELENGFFVSKFDGNSRGLHLISLDPEDFFNSLFTSGINPCGYSYTSEIVGALEKLISEGNSEFEWGCGERTIFISGPELTTVTDNFSWQDNIELPTSDVLGLIKMRKQIMDNWSKYKITKLVKYSFEKIKQDKLRYVDNKEGMRYKVYDAESGLIILMVLLEEDFGLYSEEYCNQLKFNNRFFPPQKSFP